MNITADTKIATDYIKRLRNEGAKAFQNRTEPVHPRHHTIDGRGI